MSIQSDLANYKYHYESAKASMERAQSELSKCISSRDPEMKRKIPYWMEKVDKHRSEYQDWKRHYDELNNSKYKEG